MAIDDPDAQLTLSSSSACEVTVPLYLEQHRAHTELTLTGPSGRSVRARFWLDTGGGAMIISGHLAARLGMKPTGQAFTSGGSCLAATEMPRVEIGNFPIHLRDTGVCLTLDNKPNLQRTSALGALPLHALHSYRVTINYPKNKLTISKPGAFMPQGRCVAAHFSKAGFIVVDAEVADHTYGFLLDTGGRYCMISEVAIERWLKKYPSWPNVVGAYGPANMMLGTMEASLRMLRIASLKLGALVINDVGCVSRRRGIYEKMMTNLTCRPVIGSLGGNALNDLLIDIDYPNNKLYIEYSNEISEKKLEMVGITVEPTDNGYVVVGVMDGERELKKGDLLSRIDDSTVNNLTVAQLMNKLSGISGTTHSMKIRRGGNVLNIKTKAISIL